MLNNNDTTQASPKKNLTPYKHPHSTYHTVVAQWSPNVKKLRRYSKSTRLHKQNKMQKTPKTNTHTYWMNTRPNILKGREVTTWLSLSLSQSSAFVEALDDRSAPTLSIPTCSIDDIVLTSLPSNLLQSPCRNTRSMERNYLKGGARWEGTKVTNVHGMKSYACQKTQQHSEVALSFNLWRSFNISSYEDMSGKVSGNILPFSVSSQWNYTSFY